MSKFQYDDEDLQALVIIEAPKEDLQFDTVDPTGSIKESLSDITIEWKNS